MNKKITQILNIVSNYDFHYSNELELHAIIEEILSDNSISIDREYDLKPYGTVDFFSGGIAFEVKIKGNTKKIYSQCKRYCSHKDISELVLITSKSMSLPELINGKPCYVYNLNTKRLG